MTVVATKFSTSDPFLYVLGQFSYDPARLQRWDTYMNRIQKALSSSIEHMLRKHNVPVWSDVVGAVARLDFVTHSAPGIVRCKMYGIEVTYEYVAMQGQYTSSMSFTEVLNGTHSQADHQSVFPTSQASSQVCAAAQDYAWSAQKQVA